MNFVNLAYKAQNFASLEFRINKQVDLRVFFQQSLQGSGVEKACQLNPKISLQTGDLYALIEPINCFKPLNSISPCLECAFL